MKEESAGSIVLYLYLVYTLVQVHNHTCTILLWIMFLNSLHVCPMCVCVHAHAHMCVCRRACSSTCMCVYFPRLSSGANGRGEDGDRHRGDGYRRGGGDPADGSRGVKPQQRSDRPGRHSQATGPEPLREQG